MGDYITVLAFSDMFLPFPDSAAAFRQRKVHALRDRSQENPLEVEAAKFDLNYIGLDGSIACLGRSIRYPAKKEKRKEREKRIGSSSRLR